MNDLGKKGEHHDPEILNELNCPQIILVSHERELESFADNLFSIEKVGGISQVSKIN